MRLVGLRSLFVAVVIALGCSLGAAWAANGPWVVVADSGDGSGTAINLGNGNVQIQPGVGGQVIGVATTPGLVAFSDFLGGSIRTFQATPVGQYIGAGKGQITTTPGDPSPEGITLLGDGARALITDGGTLPGGNGVDLILVDLANNAKLASLRLPSVYGAAFDPATRIAWVLDGVSMEVAAIAVGPAGTLQDTGIRVALHGTDQGVRFVASYAGGTRLLVSHKTDGAVEVIDTATQTSLGRIEGVGKTVGAIAVTPDGNKALVADFGNADWAVLDLTTPGMPTDTGMRISVASGVPNTFVGTRTFAFLGNRMYFSSTNGSVVSEIDWTTLSVIPETFATGPAPAGLALSF